jgi:hypothetical protein
MRRKILLLLALTILTVSLRGSSQTVDNCTSYPVCVALPCYYCTWCYEYEGTCYCDGPVFPCECVREPWLDGC